jgi:hypothetical protein
MAADAVGASPCDSARIAATAVLTGRWHAAETADEEKLRLQAIDEATKQLSRFKRGRARSRLAERTSPRESLIIEIEGATATVVSGDRTLEVELGGAPIEVSGDGGTARVSAKMDCARLVIMVRDDKGERTTTYEAGDAGLSMEVTLTTGKLAGPLTYVTTYARDE